MLGLGQLLLTTRPNYNVIVKKVERATSGRYIDWIRSD